MILIQYILKPAYIAGFFFQNLNSMRKIHQLAFKIIGLLIIGLITCCTKINTIPTINYSSTDNINIVRNDSLVLDTNATLAKFSVAIQSEAGITKLAYNKDSVETIVNEAVNRNSYTTDTILHVEAGKKYYFKTTVADKDVNEIYKILSIIVKSKINSYAIELKSSSDSAVISAYNMTENKGYNAAAAVLNSSKVDFLYYTSADSNAIIFAPTSTLCTALGFDYFVNSSSFSVKNATLIQSINLTAKEFDNISDNEVIAKASNLTSHEATKLKLGQVFAFQTVKGKKGLAKVTTYYPGVKGSIALIIKVQK